MVFLIRGHKPVAGALQYYLSKVDLSLSICIVETRSEPWRRAASKQMKYLLGSKTQSCTEYRFVDKAQPLQANLWSAMAEWDSVFHIRIKCKTG